jgi:asparagine synthase (glutamine-hydrolysing)
MCGITGFIACNGKSQSLQVIKAMTDSIKHRGPDDEGYYAITTDSTEIILIGNDTPQQSLSRQNSTTLDINNSQDLAVKLAFGHRRLAIVDLSDLGHQPLMIDAGNYWICFNGEVYNYVEIRDELIKRGVSFVSKSDTEVILAAYKEWGSDCLHKFNGMFAFIIYDKIHNKVFVARDRFGIKPLYYYSDATGIFCLRNKGLYRYSELEC